MRTGDDAPTDGVLTTVQGDKIGDVASGWKGPGKGGPGLKKPWKNMMTATDHAEGHAAAMMRERGLQQATLYVNNEPCDADPFGCDRILPEILPVGARLTVYGPNGYTKIYEGNGRGLA